MFLLEIKDLRRLPELANRLVWTTTTIGPRETRRRDDRMGALGGESGLLLSEAAIGLAARPRPHIRGYGEATALRNSSDMDRVTKG